MVALCVAEVGKVSENPDCSIDGACDHQHTQQKSNVLARLCSLHWDISGAPASWQRESASSPQPGQSRSQVREIAEPSRF